LTVQGSCPRCRKPITVKVDLSKQAAYAMPCYRCGAPGAKFSLRPEKVRTTIRKNPPYEKAESLYRKALALLKPSANAPEGEQAAAKNLARSMLRQFPKLWLVVGPIAGDSPPEELKAVEPEPAGYKASAFDYGFGFGFDAEKVKREAAEERAAEKREAAKERARRAKRPPKEPKPAWARRRPEGWTREDEERLAAAERAASAARRGGFQGKPFPDDRAPDGVTAAAKDGVLIWCGTGVAVLYVLGHPRSKHRTCEQAHAAADLWYAESPKKRLERYPRYESYGTMMPHRVA
jgi:hypothetical protein